MIIFRIKKYTPSWECICIFSHTQASQLLVYRSGRRCGFKMFHICTIVLWYSKTSSFLLSHIDNIRHDECDDTTGDTIHHARALIKFHTTHHAHRPIGCQQTNSSFDELDPSKNRYNDCPVPCSSVVIVDQYTTRKYLQYSENVD